jgi:hypothetical protein
MSNTSLETDNVFGDGYSPQLGTVIGDVENGLAVTLSVPV